ncbi:hypothetical protein SAMN04489761_2384 [Tenacibaculum sp. MAR_2009_124]|nr:hypothetical protein SAMN04489761_2384 [Tenacibaculum sp. MAR_2009_124]
MGIFNDLYIYEIVLLFLGTFLFLILSGGLVYYILKKEEIKKLLLFFPIPILMIAYPSIKELNISKDKIELSKYQKQYQENPEDSIARDRIEELTEELESRATSEEDLIQISKSNILLGKPEKAIEVADKIIDKNRKSTDATEEKSDEDPKEEGKSVVIKNTAYQLKKIAKIQQQTIAKKDTSGVSEKLKNLKLNPELLKISAIVKKTNKVK